MTAGRPLLLDQPDRDTLEAILRDRFGMDRRLLEIDERMLFLVCEQKRLRSEETTLHAERDDLAKRRGHICDTNLAEKFNVSKSLLHYMTKSRTP